MVQPNFFTLWMQSQTGTQSPYQQSLQTWQKTVADCWQMPSAYWQTVASIMEARSQYLQSFCQSIPVQAAEYAKCQTWAEACGQTAKWYGQQVSHAIALNSTTQAYRVSLYQQWQTLLQRNLPTAGNTYTTCTPSSASKSTPSPAPSTSSGSSSGSKTQSASTPSPSTVIPPLQTGFAKPRTQQPSTSNTPPMIPAPMMTPVLIPALVPPVAPTNFAETKPAPAQPKPATSSTSSIAATAAEALASLTRQSQSPQTQAGQIGPQTVLSQTSTSQSADKANGTTGTAEATTSATANSVARTNTSTAVAAAAARRSVVARRTQRSRRAGGR